MSTSFRQKLLNLLCSALLVCLVTALCAAATWFFALPQHNNDYGSAGALGESLMIYVLLMSLVLFWHFWDLIGPCPRSVRMMECLFRYPAFVAILAALGSFWILVGTGLFTRDSCDEPGGALYHECYLSVSSWVLTPIYVLMAGLVALCVIKAAFVAGSLIHRDAIARYAPKQETGAN
ncbi:hypothetical protein [Alteriqipengyuania sp.]|uniref:hypothetical protein n=1 Tax=Alteriqipengyuania sp. TaxID=2800692 RepID=UPI003512255E